MISVFFTTRRREVFDVDMLRELLGEWQSELLRGLTPAQRRLAVRLLDCEMRQMVATALNEVTDDRT